MDEYLGGSDSRFTSVAGLTDSGRAANALPLPVEAGTRVRFTTNVGSILTYNDFPPRGVEGTVVKVRTAQGDTTSQDERVFVLWDDGPLRAIHAEHLRRGRGLNKVGNSVRMMVADLGDLSSFFTAAAGGDDLVHKATKDLWSLRKEGESFVVERLFTDDGNPLKV